MAGEPIKPKSAGDVTSEQKTEARNGRPLPETRTSAAEDIAAFVAKARAMSPHRAGARGRLVFALDATMSRQPTWDMACTLQADMFREAAALGSLDIRLVYYRGLNECRATGWISDSAQLARLMSKIDCQGGNTQIGKVLSEARREAVASAVRAVVFVGDAMEETGRRSLRQGGRTRPAQGAGLHVPGGPRRHRRTGVPRDCAADRRCMVQVRPRCCGAIARAAARRRGLCRRRPRGAASAIENRRRRGQADRPDEMIATRFATGGLRCFSTQMSLY